MPLLTVRLAGNATLAAALRELHLTEDEVDLAYGLIAVDPALQLYALRVTEPAASRVAAGASDAAEVFADPRIEAADGGDLTPPEGPAER